MLVSFELWILIKRERFKRFLRLSAQLHMKALSLLQLASHRCRSLQRLPLTLSVHFCVFSPSLFCAFPLSALPLTSLLHTSLPCLISSIKALLSGLCQGGMLTTLGIVTLREFTPLKVFLSPPPLFLFSFPLSLSPLCLCCISVSPARWTSFCFTPPLVFLIDSSH